MVRRDILGRYRGSFGGAFWTIINPLLLMLTYFFVFGMVLDRASARRPSRTGFALYFLAGMLPWLAFSEAAGRAPSVMLEHRNFVKKLVFAVETLPVNLVVAGLVTRILRHRCSTAASCSPCATRCRASVLWLPLLLIPQLLFTAGLSWFLAALGVFVRDLGQIIGFLLTLWFFLTPICYPETKLHGPSRRHPYEEPDLHPGARLPRHFPGEPRPRLRLALEVLAPGHRRLRLGHAWFYKLRKSFPDLL